MSIAKKIAQILFEADIRLDTNFEDADAMSRHFDGTTWHLIEQAVLGGGVELTVHPKDLASGADYAVRMAARDYADKLTDEIDLALLALQGGERVAA